MYIAIATTEFVTEKHWGGIGTYSSNLAKLLSDYGHEVAIFVLSDTNEEIDWEKGIRVYRIQYKNWFKEINKIKPKIIRSCISAVWDLFGASFVINKKIRERDKQKKIDIVHFCHSGSLALFRSEKIPAVVRLSTFQPMVRHALEPVFIYENAGSDLSLSEKVQFTAMKRADIVFAPSYVVAELTAHYIKKSVEVVESPFYFNKITDDSLYVQYLYEKKYFLFFGTLNYLKGIHIIADSLTPFFENHPDFCFVFIGINAKINYENHNIYAMDYIYKTVQKRYHENIIYLSEIRNKEKLFSVIKHAEACVLPSRFDNLPNTCIEAMALEQIVIGTRNASFEQLIQDGRNGYLIERENSLQLYEKMEEILSLTEQEKDDIKKRAGETVLRLQPCMIYNNIMEVYQRAVRMNSKISGDKR